MDADTIKKSMYERTAAAGLQSNTGPDADANQMWDIYQDIQLCVLTNDVIRKQELLDLAQNSFFN